MRKQEAKEKIAKLVEKYEKLVDERKVSSFNEAQTRNEFIEPLFEFLGWDMRNLENQGEVITEENVSKGRVDLSFRLNHIPVMFLEAKALRVDLDEWKWAEQAINYSWNKSVTWAILTDFEGIKVFNAEIPPKSLSRNLFFELKWDEYLDRFDQLWLLSKESFEEKLLAEQAEKWGKLTKRKQVGEKLFEDLTNWRAKLTKDFKKNNNVDEDALDEGVQKVLDRLIFIRTAEDRQIEPNILLSVLREWETAGKKKSVYKKLTDTFKRFDEDYNSKLFASHALEEWEASNKIIEEIIKGLYQTADGYRYDFSAISTDVLGGIYEQYLGYVQGKTQKDSKGKKSKRKSQGIYYTPKYIVEYLIEQTLGEVLKKAKKKDLSNIKILDPACGSGSFLISAYDKMLEAKNKLEMQTGLFDKFEILKNNIYGVDLDEQAIEIARLNLLLRVLSQKIKLPTLSHNIRIGNSLVEGEMEKLEECFGEKWREQKAFNWKQEFEEVFANSKIATVTADISANLKKLKVLEKKRKIKIFQVKIENDTKKIKNKSFPVAVCNYTKINECVLGDDSSDFEDLKRIIGKDKIKDCIHLENHIRNKRDFFVTEDSDFLSKKIALKNKFPKLKIVTPDELNTFFNEVSGFDVVIGNPPYGAELSKIQQEYFKKEFDVGSTDTAILFIKKAFDLLENGGKLGFIVPKAFCFASNWKKIREYIGDNLETIVDCGKVWKEVKLEQVIFIVKKGRKKSHYNSAKVTNGQIKNIGRVDKKDAESFGFFLNGVSNKEIEIAKKIKGKSIMLNDFSTNQRGAILQKYISNKGDKNVIGGAQVQQGGIMGVKGKIDSKNIDSEQAFIKNNSVLVQNIVAHIENPIDHIKITACVPENKNLIIVDTINQITLNKKYNPHFIVSLLHSQLINWYAYRFIFGKAIRTMHFDNSVTSRLPIPEADEKQQAEIAKLAQLMLDLQKELQQVTANTDKHARLKAEIEKLDEKIDQVIYKLYDFTNEEIKIIKK